MVSPPGPEGMAIARMRASASRLVKEDSGQPRIQWGPAMMPALPEMNWFAAPSSSSQALSALR